eukprot:21174_4
MHCFFPISHESAGHCKCVGWRDGLHLPAGRLRLIPRHWGHFLKRRAVHMGRDTLFANARLHSHQNRPQPPAYRGQLPS